MFVVEFYEAVEQFLVETVTPPFPVKVLMDIVRLVFTEALLVFSRLIVIVQSIRPFLQFGIYFILIDIRT